MTDETLGQKQNRFASLLPGLITHAISLSIDVRLGDLFRDLRVDVLGLPSGLVVLAPDVVMAGVAPHGYTSSADTR